MLSDVADLVPNPILYLDQSLLYTDSGWITISNAVSNNLQYLGVPTSVGLVVLHIYPVMTVAQLLNHSLL